MNERVVTLFVFQKVRQSNKLVLEFQSAFVLFSLLIEVALLILSDIFNSDVNAELDKYFIFNLLKCLRSDLKYISIPFRVQISVCPMLFVFQSFGFESLQFQVEDIESSD